MTNCPHTEVIETLRATGPHYSDLRCKACGKHMGFGKSPESLARTAKREAAIVLLRNDARLSAWERGFIATLDTQGPKISPKQADILDQLITRFLT
jgi:hypothetical protein